MTIEAASPITLELEGRARARAAVSGLNLIVLTLVALSLPALIGFTAWRTDFGRLTTPIHSTDWAQHMTMVEVLAAGRDPVHETRLGAFSAYPNWGHSIAAQLANSTHISPLKAYQLVGAAAMATMAAAVAWRITSNLHHRRLIAGAVGLAVAIAGLVELDSWGLSLNNFLLINGFWPQAIGTAVAYAGLVIVQPVKARPLVVAVIAVLGGGVILPNIVLLPAVWFAGALLLMVASGTGSVRFRASVVTVSAVSIVVLWWTNQHVRIMLTISDWNGNFGYRYGLLEQHPSVIYVAFLLSLVTSAGVFMVRAASRRRPARLIRALEDICRDHPGILAAQAAGLGALIVFQTGYGGSWYAVAKWIPLVLTETTIAASAGAADLVALLSSLLARTGARHKALSRKWAAISLLGAYSLAIIAARPVANGTYDQTPVIATRNALISNRAEAAGLEATKRGRLYPQTNLGFIQNFYLAIGVLDIPLDDRTKTWLAKAYQGDLSGGEAALPPSLPSGAVWLPQGLRPVQIAPTFSVQPEAPAYSVDWIPAPEAQTSMSAGTTETWTVSMSNSGSMTWTAGGQNPVHLGYEWRSGSCPGTGNPTYGNRAVLPEDIAPGTTISNLAINVTAPSKRGTYCLSYDLVQELITWFSGKDAATLDVTVIVN